jgi:hypothetical protein
MQRLLVIAALTMGCYSPNVPNGKLKCSTDNKCPDGFHCAADGTCWKNGQDPMPSPMPDMLMPDMAQPKDGGADGGEIVKAHKGNGVMSGGVTATSEHFKVIMSTGDSPGGGAKTSSTNFKRSPGVVGATQNTKK